MTTPRRMAPAFATTSTCRTWPRATWQRCRRCSAAEKASPSTWEPAAATACWRSCTRLRRAADVRCPARSRPAARVTWRNAMQTQPWRTACWAGRRSTPWMRCAQTPGAGKARTRTATAYRLTDWPCSRGTQRGLQVLADFWPLCKGIHRVFLLQDAFHAGLHVAQRLGVAEDVKLIGRDGIEHLLRHFSSGDFA